ncbi:hypothetical protein [Fulvivirga lutea]|uniref:Uncharacterized protein n=1 Tax=Fulvivirga lutea TaxID=2810512 RepID=A0A974WJB3_9BACT|nr:hypothetical protein [Fulvivirga lutea]QSE98257.1 hypothetical protein JR347_04035 [Fulvivirga lutea]
MVDNYLLLLKNFGGKHVGNKEQQKFARAKLITTLDSSNEVISFADTKVYQVSIEDFENM